MNRDKELEQTQMKTKVHWCAILVIFSMVLGFSSCEKDCDCPEDKPEGHPSLKIENQVTDDRSIYAVRLVGYEFNDLNIASGNSQTFTLDEGMSAGYSEINVTVSYGTSYRPSNSRSINVDFTKGEVTKITLKGCISYEGCGGHYIE